MMQNNLLFSFLFLALFFLASCSVKTVSRMESNTAFQNKYSAFLEEGSTVVSGSYTSMVEQTTSGQYIFKSFYPSNNRMTEYITYEDRNLKIKNGLSTEWYDNGNKWSEGHYKRDEKVGEWKYYHFKTGELSSYGQYENNKKKGVWVSLDSLGNKNAQYTYLNNLKEGKYTLWNEDGSVRKEGEYVQDKLVSGEEASEKTPEKMPEFKGCEQETDQEARTQCAQLEMLKFIYKNIKYPALARENGVEGTAIIRFVVDKDGTVKDAEAMRGICNEIRDECLRIVNTMPAWHPGYQNGEPVRVFFNLPVKFRLE